MRPVFNPYNAHAGFVYYDTDLDSQIMWNGKDWVGTDGMNLKKTGTSKERPIDYINVGFLYKDTDINELIVWDGDCWRDLKGNIR
jgi:hypothetical protein